MKNTIFCLTNFKFSYPFSSSQINLTGELKINQGDIVLINGKSGSGKSTLLYALKGLIPEFIPGSMQGSIYFKHKPIHKLEAAEKRQIGLVLQNPDSQMISHQVLPELAFGLENLAVPPAQILSKINQTTQNLKLEYLLTREINSLSGGEKQKIALLSVLLTDPEVILLDEPTAFLDPASAQTFIQLLTHLAGTKTIIIIEHNLHYLKSLANRYLEIEDDGQIVEKSLAQVNWAPTLNQPTLAKLSPLADTLLEVRNLTYRYSKDSPNLLQQLSFQLKRGEIIGLRGASGSGKSTLLKILAKLIKIPAGQVFWQNQEITKISPKTYYKQLALLFQNPEHHFLFNTVAQELVANPALLELVGLTQHKEQNPFTLSEGQKRRLSIAILCATLKRQVYLLDEPTFGQDNVNKQILLDLISQMQQSGASFIIVSHDKTFLTAICHKLFTLTQGQLYESV